VPNTTARDYSAVLNDHDVRSAQLHVLFDDAPVGIAYVAVDGTFMKVNGAYCDMLGYAATELEGRRRWVEVTHPDDVVAAEAENALVLAGEKRSYRMAIKHLHKRGYSVPVDLTVDRVQGRGEEFVLFVVHSQGVQLSDEFYRLQTRHDGTPEIVPFYPLMRLLKDNWKAVGLALMTFLGTAGTVVRGHYQALAQIEAQIGQLEQARKDLDLMREENRWREAKIEELTNELRRAAKTFEKGNH